MQVLSVDLLRDIVTCTVLLNGFQTFIVTLQEVGHLFLFQLCQTVEQSFTSAFIRESSSSFI